MNVLSWATDVEDFWTVIYLITHCAIVFVGYAVNCRSF